MAIDDAKEEYDRIKRHTMSLFGSAPLDWIQQRIGNWDVNLEILKPLLLVLGAVKAGKLLVGDKGRFFQEGLALVALYCGEKSPRDALTIVDDSLMIEFQRLDATARIGPIKAVERCMLSILARTVENRIATHVTATRRRDSFTKIGVNAITMEIRESAPEEMVLDFAHELAHVRQRQIPDSFDSTTGWKLFLGKHLTAIIDYTKDDGPHYVAYRRNILERDADLFASSIGRRIDKEKYALAQEEVLLSD